MDSNLKLFLIIIAFVVILILLFCTPSYKHEHFDASLDPYYNDPRQGSASYSRNIKYRPDSDLSSVDSKCKLFDHLADQALGVTQYSAQDNGDYDKNYEMMSEESSNKVKKRVRFSDDYPTSISKPVIRNVNIETSFQDTEDKFDRVIETNNIQNYCVRNDILKNESEKPYYVNIPVTVSVPVQVPVAANTNLPMFMEDMEMNVGDEEYQNMLINSDDMKKIFIENIDEDDIITGLYDSFYKVKQEKQLEHQEQEQEHQEQEQELEQEQEQVHEFELEQEQELVQEQEQQQEQERDLYMNIDCLGEITKRMNNYRDLTLKNIRNNQYNDSSYKSLMYGEIL